MAKLKAVNTLLRTKLEKGEREDFTFDLTQRPEEIGEGKDKLPTHY